MSWFDELSEGDKAKVSSLIEEPYHEYWFHFGKFMHMYAKAEEILLRLLYDISGLSDVKAGAIFSGVRSEGARDTINNILEATGQKDKKERLSQPFAQMTAIGTIRNNLVHFGVDIDENKKITVSNTKRYPINPKLYAISINDFLNMYQDIALIYLLIAAELNDPTISVGEYDSFSLLPWQYKPPQPYPPGKKQHQDRPRSLPPRGASRRSRPPRGGDGA